MFPFFSRPLKNGINGICVCNFLLWPVIRQPGMPAINIGEQRLRRSVPTTAGGRILLLSPVFSLPALVKGKALERSVPYFSCRLSQRELCGPGIHFCTAAFRKALTRQAGASRRCPPASWTWRRWSHTGCPRAPRRTSAALPHRYGNTENTRVCGDGCLRVRSH